MLSSRNQHLNKYLDINPYIFRDYRFYCFENCIMLGGKVQNLFFCVNMITIKRFSFCFTLLLELLCTKMSSKAYSFALFPNRFFKILTGIYIYIYLMYFSESVQ